MDDVMTVFNQRNHSTTARILNNFCAVHMLPSGST